MEQANSYYAMFKPFKLDEALRQARLNTCRRLIVDGGWEDWPVLLRAQNSPLPVGANCMQEFWLSASLAPFRANLCRIAFGQDYCVEVLRDFDNF